MSVGYVPYMGVIVYKWSTAQAAMMPEIVNCDLTVGKHWDLSSLLYCC